jgi:hypothetical protein
VSETRTPSRPANYTKLHTGLASVLLSFQYSANDGSVVYELLNPLKLNKLPAVSNTCSGQIFQLGYGFDTLLAYITPICYTEFTQGSPCECWSAGVGTSTKRN